MVSHFVVNLDEAPRHVVRVTLRLSNLGPGPHELLLPVWQPGFYEIQDFSRHLFGMEGQEDGHALAIEKVAKNRWRFTSQGGTIEVRYQVYAFTLTVYGSHVDASHAYWNGTNIFLAVDNETNSPVDLVIEAPPGWIASTGLERVEGQAMAFRAPSYDVLYDCPVEVGTHRRRTFQVDGVPHEIAVYGEGNEDLDQLERDITRLVKTASRYFGGLPYPHYTFIFHVADAVGGLEHANSTTCGFSRTAFRPWAAYRRVLGLIAHEFVHLWNVKRIHPEGLGPFDYHHEATTELLWTMEGVTEYVTRLVLCRAGLIPPEEFLAAMADDMRELELKPGRHVMSLADASYNIFANRAQVFVEPNRSISYYLKGCLVGMLLDLEIRRATGHQRSLDDVLRLLWQRYGMRGVGFPEAAFRETAEEVSRENLAVFWHRYVVGTDDIDWDDCLESVGLGVERRHIGADGRPALPSDPEPGTLGLEYQRGPGPARVRAAFDPGPSAGLLHPGDEIVAIDGGRVTTVEDVEARISTHRPSDSVRVHVFRRGRLETVPVRLGIAPKGRWRLFVRAQAGETARRGYSRWLEPDPVGAG